jgi:hypothetical protein
VDRAVPDVGSLDTPWSEVSAFYDFWYSFKSWREFPHPDEEDVESAESREHRRWIERCGDLRGKGLRQAGRARIKGTLLPLSALMAEPQPTVSLVLVVTPATIYVPVVGTAATY